MNTITTDGHDLFTGEYDLITDGRVLVAEADDVQGFNPVLVGAAAGAAVATAAFGLGVAAGTGAVAVGVGIGYAVSSSSSSSSSAPSASGSNGGRKENLALPAPPPQPDHGHRVRKQRILDGTRQAGSSAGSIIHIMCGSVQPVPWR